MFEVKIIKDSIGPNNKRITTLTATYPRFIHCYDDQTEVLCEVGGVRGFRKWSEIVGLKSGEIKIAAYGNDGGIRFEEPSEIISSDYDGPMVYCENQRLSFCVTPNHRMYVGCRKSWGDSWEVHEAEMLLDAPQRRVKTTGRVLDGESIGKVKAEILGFFVGDGSIPKQGQQIIFHLVKQRKIKYLHKLLRKLGVPFTYRPYTAGDSNTILNLSDLPECKGCYTEDDQKTIPDKVMSSTPEEMVAFLNGLWNSDGSTDNEITRQHNTSSPHTADRLSALATMCGKRINLTERYDNGMYKLCESTEISPIIRGDKNPPRHIKYIGKVYCATVTSGLLIIRRNGLTLVSTPNYAPVHSSVGGNIVSCSLLKM